MNEDDVENKVISILSEIGITFPVSILYPDGKEKIVTNVEEISTGKRYTNNLLYFPLPYDSA